MLSLRRSLQAARVRIVSLALTAGTLLASAYAQASQVEYAPAEPTRLRAFGVSLATARRETGAQLLAISYCEHPMASIRCYSLPRGELRNVISLGERPGLVYPFIATCKGASSTDPDRLLVGYAETAPVDRVRTGVELLSLDGVRIGLLEAIEGERGFGQHICPLSPVGGQGLGHAVVHAFVGEAASRRERFVVFDLTSMKRTGVFDGPLGAKCLWEGVTMCSLSDLDADGRTDFAVECGGIVYLISSAKCEPLQQVGEARSPASRSQVANAMVSIPDIDGDGKDDLAVGVPNVSDDLGSRGEVRLLSSKGLQLVKTLPGNKQWRDFGFAMAVLDRDREGRGPTLAVSHYNGAFEGGVSVYSLKDARLESSAEWVQADPPQLGWRVLSLGDIDSDGYGDYASSRYMSEDPGGDDQEVVVFSGRTGRKLCRMRSPGAHTVESDGK